MKKLKEMVDRLDAKPVCTPDGWETRNVQRVFASDLISDILVSDGDEILLLTSLQSDQVLRTAEVIGASAVVLVNRKQVSAALGRAAAKHTVPLFFTPLPKFDACVRLGKLLESA